MVCIKQFTPQISMNIAIVVV